ncbi:MAG: glycosyltransferase family 1 protein [Ignavibacteriales bacterium]|nr:MAG: glycosyltransferase family 1 protein [Ignavibacteriales bacterium]
MPLNILFINSITIYGGGEVWMITAAKELIKRGHSVTIVCRPASQLQKYALQNKIPVISLKIRGDIDPVTIIKLSRIITKKSINIILTNMDKELRLSGIASKISGRGKLVARHGIDFPLKNKLHYRITYNYLTDSIIANSEATKKTMLKNAPWINQNKINVIYNGINVNEFDIKVTYDLRKKVGIPESVPLIGFAGRLSVQKGIKYLLEAFLLIRNSINGHLLISGTGELENEIKDFIFKNKLQGFVHLLGFRDDINNVMKTIDLLVLPSLWEGFGIVLIEAMASGKPCITTRISSMPEIVVDNISGIIVPPEDSFLLSEACKKILTNKELANRMGAEGKRIVNEKFTIEKMTDNYERIFYELSGRINHHHR